MEKQLEKVTLIRTIRNVTLIIYSIGVLLFAILGIYDRYTLLKYKTNQIRFEYTDKQKLIVKTQVQSAVQLIQLARDSGISQEDILKSLKTIRFGVDRDGYIFVNTYDGIPLLFDANRVIDGDSIWELTDPNGVKVIQEEREAVRNPEGDFIYYSWLKLSTNKVSPKVSFIKGVMEWEWLVGAGVYLDSIEVDIASLQKQMLKETGFQALIILFIVIIILFTVQHLFRLFTKTVEKEVWMFSSYFDNAADRSEEIDLSAIRYKEFSDIAEDMNKMVNSKLDADARIFTSEQRLRLQREQSPLGYIEYDLDFTIVYWNPSAERIFGYSKEEMLGKGLDAMLPPELLDPVSTVFKQMMEGTLDDINGIKNINKNITKSGKQIICEWYNKCLTDKSGTVLGIIALVNDITERKAVEDQLVRSLDEKQVLIKEVHHRVKNNMAIISSFISLQSMNIKDDSIQSMLQSTENRVSAMALIHEYLYKSENLKDINVKKYIDELIKMLLSSYDYCESDLSTKVEIVQLKLELDMLIPLGMLINEIISNALKHAFNDIESPELFISLNRNNQNGIFLTIRDNGIGIPHEDELLESDSIGFLLINSLVDQIHGKLTICRDSGTEYVITIPVI
jgi:PAS domain S-box-containing protein